jgi:hypothetical protein
MVVDKPLQCRFRQMGCIPSVEHVPCVRDQPRCLQRENPSGVHMSKTIDEKAVKLPPLK